jgi:PAS domain S-box-containing protein
MHDLEPIAMQSPRAADPAPDFLRGGGEMGALMRAHDWQSTTIGSPDAWPQSLRTAIRLLLNSGHPMYVWWGPDLLCFYNDAYRQSIGPERHPGSLGRKALEVWGEIWDIIEPQIAQVISGGGATWRENALVPITRNGRREEVYWTYSYSPIDDSAAATGVGGVLVVCTETTQQVLSARRAAEEQQKLSELFEQAPGFMAMLRGPEHRLELANPSFLRLIGRRDVLGRTVAEAIPEAGGQGFLELLDTVYRTGQPFAANGASYAAQPVAGGPVDEHYIDFVFQPIKDAAGAVTGIFVEGVDVTGRAVADAALRESEHQLRLATDAAEVGLWDLDIGTDTLYWPARVKAMFGISADEPISMVDFYNGLHPDDKARTSAAFAAALDPVKRALYDVEYRTIGKEDGLVRWVAAKGRAIFEGDRCVRVIGTAIDITSRKATDEQLRELNEELERRVAEALAERKVFADIVESTDAQVLVLDRDFCIMAINRATTDELHRVYGFRPTVGDNLLEALGRFPEEQQQVRHYWGRALAGEEFMATDEFGHPSLLRRHYEMKFNSLRDRGGKLVGAFQFVHDVTDRLRDQARLAEAETHLRQAQKIDALGQLTGGVAHDFNNLLMVISGGLSLLERSSEPERRQRILAQMRQATDRGASLSRQLLAFARRQPLKPEPIDLRRQLAGMRDLLDRTLRGDVLVKTDLATDLWPIKADPVELELVILNLCVNARDAMPNGGTITISANNAESVRDGGLAGDFVSLCVEDCGTGMSEDVLAHIFEPFFTTKEIGKGSGLGLPQVYGFAQQSGGSVRVNTVLGRGTKMILLLPRTEAPATEPTAPMTDPDSSARRRALRGSVLLVEDNDEVASLVTEMLVELGYRAIRAASAQGALGALADDRAVDLVFTDVLMPGTMNGMELAREVRRRRPHMPILLTSGYSGAAFEEAASEHINVLRKPYEINALDAALRAALANFAQRE